MFFAAAWNGFAGRIWPADRSLETPDIYEEEWWQHTPLSECNTTENSCNLTPPTRTLIVSRNTLTWRSVTDGRQHHRLLLQAATLPKALHEEPGHILSRGQRNMCISLWHVPKISRNFVGEWNFDLLCYGRYENRIGYQSALVQLFRGIFLQGTWRTLFLGD